MERHYHNIIIAVEAIAANKLKSMLTALGIIFGVAAVISMLAIGNGAQQEILEQIKLVGVNNIVVVPIVQRSDNSNDDGQSPKQKFSPGLRISDGHAIRAILPGIKAISPEISIATYAVYQGRRSSVNVKAVTNDYFSMFSIEAKKGSLFNFSQIAKAQAVCIIGANIKTRFFGGSDAIGKKIKAGSIWLKIVGITPKRAVSVDDPKKSGYNNTDNIIYIPFKTGLMRYSNRSLITKQMLNVDQDDENKKAKPNVNYNQIDRLVVQVKETEKLQASANIISRVLNRRHQEVMDFEVSVPELLLKQQQRTKDVFNIVLGAIAGISLLVGGIGIMNIMLASVLERVREIGTRRAIGATQTDIITQFLAEAGLISFSGGIIGVIGGVVTSMLITQFADILTIVSGGSIIVAFGVSASVGVLFGYLPAKRAAKQSPVDSLRQ